MTRLVLLAAALLAAPVVAHAQPRRDAPELPAGGFDIFRAIIDLAKITPVTARDLERSQRYDDMILVSFGDMTGRRGIGAPPLFLAERVLGGGGAVLIVHDSPTDITLARNHSTQIDGRRVAVTRPELAYQGRVFDPLLVPEPGDDPVDNLFAGLNRVATEHPSFLNLMRFGVDNRRILARFPAGGSVFQTSGAVFDTNRFPFAVADAPQRRGGRVEYRLIVMADHAVFKNSLMAPAATDGQTDNILLAQRTIEYLQGPDKARKRCAFYEDGQLVEDFDTVRMMLQQQDPMPNLPNPLALLLANQPAITDLGDKLLDEVQTRDLHNTILLGSPDNPGGQARRLMAIATAFLVMGSVWAAVFLLRRVWKSRQPTDNPPPPYAGGSVTADRSGGVFDRRRRELVRRNNLYEPVRDALHALFVAAGVHGGPGMKPPPIECTNEVRKPAKLRAAIHDLWRLAYGKPAVVSVRRSEELTPVIERLHREHAEGTWWFAGTSSTS